MSTPVKFWDKIARNYSKMPIRDEAAYQRKLEITRRYFRPGMELLELGCGTGSTAIIHAPYVKHLHAVDISANMLEIARRRASEQDIENISFEQATIDAFAVDGKAYDMVLGLSILHLLDNWQEVIGKVHTMLKPGGLFVTSTTCMADGMRWFGLMSPLLYKVGLIPKVEFFTQQELEQALAAQGFDIIENWKPDGKMKAVFIIARKS